MCPSFSTHIFGANILYRNSLLFQLFFTINIANKTEKYIFFGNKYLSPSFSNVQDIFVLSNVYLDGHGYVHCLDG